MTEAASRDLSEVIADVEAEVARRRARGDYPAELLARLRIELEVRAENEPIESLANLTLHGAVPRRRGPFGLAISTIKRAIRRAIAWYVLPMLNEQLRFNRAAATEVRRLERRLDRLQPLWERPPGTVPFEAALLDAGELLARRSRAATQALAQLPVGRVAVLGPWREQLERALIGGGFDIATADASADDPMSTLQALPRGELAAIVAIGVVPSLAAADLLRLPAATAASLLPGGRLVLDAFDSAAPIAPAVVDVGVQRWLPQETLRLLMESASFRDIQVVESESLLAQRVSWYAVVGTNAAR